MNDRRELSFDSVADEYEQTRPTYPAALLDALPLDADAAVLDLGAGTGKLTRVLAERYRDVSAVEPLANMRAMLERVVPGVTALIGSTSPSRCPRSRGYFGRAASSRSSGTKGTTIFPTRGRRSSSVK